MAMQVGCGTSGKGCGIDGLSIVKYPTCDEVAVESRSKQHSLFDFCPPEMV